MDEDEMIQAVPDNLVERKESLKEDMWWKKWLEHYNKNAEE